MRRSDLGSGLVWLVLAACGGQPAGPDVGESADPSRGELDAATRDAAALDARVAVTFDAFPAPVPDARVDAGVRSPATSLHFPTSLEPHVGDAPFFNITRPTDLSAPAALLPVVVWANGGCLRSDFTWSPLFERWASAGYVVLSLTSPSEDDGLGELLGMFGTTSKVEHRALIDWVVRANASGPYAGKLDLARIVLAGNSCGGVTALEAAAEDARAAAVFVLSGSSAVGSVNEAVMKALSIPVGYVIGGEEDIAGVNARADYAAMNDGVPAMIVSRREGDHLTVSSDALILPEDAELALQWMDLALYGSAAAYDALTSPDVCPGCTPGDWTLTSKNLPQLRE